MSIANCLVSGYMPGQDAAAASGAEKTAAAASHLLRTSRAPH
jgi:hypothetical protein